MTLPEKHAREKGLHGIIMMHSLLKSEYLLARGLKDEAIDILKDSLGEEFSDTTRTLYERIQEKLIKLHTIKDH